MYQAVSRPAGRSRRRVIALVTALTAAVTGFGGQAFADSPGPVPGQAVPAGTAAGSGLPDGPVQVARAKARSTGKPVTVDELTTETGLTVANPDGTLTQTSHLLPTRVKVKGAWTPVDATLAKNADGTLSPKATPSGVALSGGGNTPIAAFTDSRGRRLSLTMPFPLPAPTVSGNSATYADVLPGVDLKASVTDQGAFREVLVVHNAAAAANPALKSLRLAVGGGLTTDTAADGTVTAKAADGTAAFTLPAPVMWDSSHSESPAPAAKDAAPAARSNSLAAAPVQGTDPDASSEKGPGRGAHITPLKVRAEAGALTLTPDAEALTGAQVSWPVYIDPYVNPAPGRTNHFTQVKEGCPGTDFLDNAQENGESIGYQQYSSTCFGLSRSYYEFDTSNLDSRMVVSESKLYFTETHGADKGCGNAWPVTLKFTGGIDHNTFWPGPGDLGTIATKDVLSSNIDSGCGNHSLDFDVTDTVRQHLGINNLTFGLYGNESKYAKNYGFMRFSVNPYMETKFDVRPNTPTNLGTTPDSQNPAGPGCGSAPGWIGMTTSTGGASNVTLNAQLTTDMSGVNLHGGYRVWDDTANDGSGHPATVNWIWSDWVGNGGTVRANVGIPLSDGHAYGWNVWANDGTLDSPAAPDCHFDVDLSPPTLATITPSAAFPALGSGSTATGHAGDTATVKVSSSDPTPGGCTLNSCLNSGIQTFQYSLDVAIPATGAKTVDPVITNGVATADIPITVPNNQWGTHTLYVRAVDKAGNSQATPATYNFYAPWNPSAKVTAGDLTGDGVPDMLATTTDGNLTLIGGNTDPGATPVNASTTAQSPDRTGWNNYLIAHRGSITQQDKDDLFAYQKSTHNLYVYKNDASATPPGTSGHFSLTQNVQGPLLRPSCVATAAGNCSSYPANWSSVTQMVAAGPLSIAAYNAKHPDQPQSLAPDLVTVENGKLWYYISGANASTYFDSAYQIGTGDWTGTTVVGVANVGAVTTGTGANATSAGGTPTLWVRNDVTGAVSSFRLTFDANGIPTTNIGAPAKAPLVSGILDTAGKNLCLDVRNSGTTDGTPVQVYTCNGSDAQSAALGQDGSVHLLGKCLDAYHSGTANGTPVNVWECNNGVAQKWVPGPTAGSLMNPNSGKCLADPGSSNSPGTQLVLWDCIAGIADQNWAATTAGSALPTAQALLPLSVSSKTYPAVSTPGDLDGDGNPELYAVAIDSRIMRRSGADTSTGPLVDRWKLADTTDAVRTNALALNGGATIGADATRGSALSLNGTSAYALSAATAVDTSQSFTVSAWVNLAGIPTQNVTAVSQDGTQNSGFYLQYNTAAKGWCLNSMASDTATSLGSGREACSTANVKANTWVHLAGVYDASDKSAKLYVNGTLSASTTGMTPWAAGGKVAIGSALYHGARTDWFPGLVSDVQVRSGAVTAVAQFGPSGTAGYLQRQPGDEWKLTDTSDAVRPANALTLNGSASFTNDAQRGRVFSPGGTNGFATAPGSVLDPTKSFTVSLWAKSNSSDGVIIGQDGNSAQSFMIWPDNGTWRFAMATADTNGWVYDWTGNVTGAAAVQAGAWTHLTAVYDATAGQMSLYANGALAGTGAHQPGPAFNGNLVIGRWHNNGANANFFAGSVSDVQVWQSALAPATVATLASGTQPVAVQLS